MSPNDGNSDACTPADYLLCLFRGGQLPFLLLLFQLGLPPLGEQLPTDDASPCFSPLNRQSMTLAARHFFILLLRFAQPTTTGATNPASYSNPRRILFTHNILHLFGAGLFVHLCFYPRGTKNRVCSGSVFRTLNDDDWNPLRTTRVDEPK